MTAITSGDGTVVRIAEAIPDRTLPVAAGDLDARVAQVGSTGATAVEPLVAVTRDGETSFHTRCSDDELDDLFSALAETADPGAGDADAVVEHDPGTTGFPAVDLSGLAVGVREVTSACGWRRPANPTDHDAAGGFLDSDPGAVLDLGTQIRGRGWGDWCRDEYPAETWRTASDADTPPTVVVNGHGNRADTLLLASAPFEVLDGATSLAGAVDADRVVVYASDADERALETVRTAVDNYPDLAVSVDVSAGPADYRAAEPTMALEALEGNHRLEARLRPPGPEQSGLDGVPTLVHTPRTMAHLAVARREGEPRATRVVTVTGDVTDEATVELAGSASLADALEAVDPDGAVKAACVGGQFGGLTSDLDVSVDPESLAEADLGTEGTVQVLTEDRCVVEFVGQRARFASEENCGRCVPCREGTTQLAELLRDLYDGGYDPSGIRELVRVMERSSICVFGVDAGRPTRTALTAFESEFEAHAAGRCPAGQCADALEAA